MGKMVLSFLIVIGMGTVAMASLTLSNTDFEGGVDGSSTPNGWTEIAANHAGAFYANVTDASGGSNHNLYMQGRGNGNIIQQSFGGGTADTQGTIEIKLDAGWRNDPSGTQTYDWVLQIYNVTDDVALSTVSYTLAPDGLGAAPDPRTIDVQKLFTFTYDNTVPSLLGDEIAFRITSNSNRNSWDPTGFVDNINIVPEPGTLGLVASFGACILFVRRKLMV